jgi:hypothetical protein
LVTTSLKVAILMNMSGGLTTGVLQQTQKDRGYLCKLLFCQNLAYFKDDQILRIVAGDIQVKSLLCKTPTLLIAQGDKSSMNHVGPSNILPTLNFASFRQRIRAQVQKKHYAGC